MFTNIGQEKILKGSLYDSNDSINNTKNRSKLNGTTSLILFAITFVSGLFVWATREREEVSATTTGLSQSLIAELSALATRMEPMAENSAHPTDMAANEDFKRAVTILSWPSCSLEQASNYAPGANWILCCAAFAAGEPDAWTRC